MMIKKDNNNNMAYLTVASVVICPHGTKQCVAASLSM